MLRYLFGWSPLSAKIDNRLANIDRAILLFPHTSILDTLTFLPYVNQRCFKGRTWAIARESVVNSIYGKVYFPHYFKPIIVPERTDGETGTGGFINYAYNKLHEESRFLLLMSPEGAREKKQWKSGYYHLARKLQVPIIVIGMDFVDHCVKVAGIVDVNWSELSCRQCQNQVTISVYEDAGAERSVEKLDSCQLQDVCQAHLQRLMSKIRVLHPSSSFVPISDPGRPQFLHPTLYYLYLIIIVIIIIVIIYFIYKRLRTTNKHK